MYFITTVSEQHGNRCVGYYTKWFKAIKAVENNNFDLNEAGYYPYAVIENVKEGIYQYDFKPLWFKFNDKTEKYEKIDKAPSFIDKHYIGFGIG